MDETAEREIRRLKDDLLKKKGEIEDLRALVNREIDREFQTEALDLTERELEPFIEKSLRDMKDNLILKADPGTLKSHRRILGRPVLFLKRTFMTWADVYFKMTLKKQSLYNQSTFDLLKVLILRSRWSKEKLKDLEKRLAGCEESLVVVIHRLDDLRERLEKGNDPGSR